MVNLDECMTYFPFVYLYTYDFFLWIIPCLKFIEMLLMSLLIK